MTIPNRFAVVDSPDPAALVFGTGIVGAGTVGSPYAVDLTPYARAYAQATSGVAFGSAFTMDLSASNIEQTESMVNASTNKITVPRNGVYRVSAHIEGALTAFAEASGRFIFKFDVRVGVSGTLAVNEAWTEGYSGGFPVTYGLNVSAEARLTTGNEVSAVIQGVNIDGRTATYGYTGGMSFLSLEWMKV